MRIFSDSSAAGYRMTISSVQNEFLAIIASTPSVGARMASSDLTDIDPQPRTPGNELMRLNANIKNTNQR